MTTKAAVLSETAHCIVSHRSLGTLIEWAKNFSEQEAQQGRRVIWAPCHALGRSLSLRSWIIEQASEMLGSSAPVDAPTLLSGAADSLIIADPSSSDRESLNWLGELLACAKEVHGLTTAPPLPRLIVLLPLKGNASDMVNDFTNRLVQFGSEDEKLPGRESDYAPIEIDGMLRGMPIKTQDFMAAVSLAPFPLSRAEYAKLAEATSATPAEVKALFESPLFYEVAGAMVPVCPEVRERIRAPLAPEALTRAARLLLDVCQSRLSTLPDAAIELHARSGDQRQAARLAKRRVSDHEGFGRFSEALRIMRLGRELGFVIEQNVPEIDEAHTAALTAEVGDFMAARELVKALVRRRNLFKHADFIEWLAMALRTLAMRDGFEPRTADSLMRRAIRMNKSDIDRKVRLTVSRVSLLRSQAFTLDERADWLLTHINQVTLNKVTTSTLAKYLEETGRQLAQDGMYKRAFKRLRRMISIATSDQQLGEALLLMSRCRTHFSDTEGATRFAWGALQYGLRCASLSLVKEAAALLRQGGTRAQAADAKSSKKKDKLKPRPAVVDEVSARAVAKPEQIFDIMKKRFGVTRWARRRGTRVESFGAELSVKSENTIVYEESGGKVRCLTQAGGDVRSRSLVLLRSDGDDLIQLAPDTPAEFTEEGIVRFLLADRESAAVSDSSVAPLRKNVVDEYMRRATNQPAERGLHKAIETLFNKDLLMYLEDQGFTKEDMASHLGVSRATLYRMYSRAGLN